MNLQAWAEWVTQIAALTQGGRVVLMAEPYGMTVAVEWEQDGQRMRYGHALSMIEMKAMYEVVQPCVLEQITNAVRKMTPNASLEGCGAAGGASLSKRLFGTDDERNCDVE